MLQIPPGGSQEGKRDRGEQGWAGFGGVSPCHHAILGEGLKVQGESRPRDTAGKYLVRRGEGIKKEKKTMKKQHMCFILKQDFIRRENRAVLSHRSCSTMVREG